MCCFPNVVEETLILLAEDCTLTSNIEKLTDSLFNVVTTNTNRATLNNKINLAFSYDILPVESFTGEYKVGADGFEEFYADESAIISWVLNTFYVPQQQTV